MDINSEFEARNAWGMHTVLDLFDCNPDAIRDYDTIAGFIEDIIKRIKMKAYGAPTIVRFGPTPRVLGYSFTQLIETSLIAGHCIEETNALCVDVFSCKSFDPNEVLKCAAEWFSPGSYRIMNILRGDPHE